MSKSNAKLHVMYPAGLQSGDFFIFAYPEMDPFDHDLNKYGRYVCCYQGDMMYVNGSSQKTALRLNDKDLVVKVNIVPAHLCNDSFLTVRKEDTSKSYTLACSVCGREKSYDIIINKSAYP